MSRDLTVSALVLKTSPVGEIHRSVTLLARERGLLRVMVHGAAQTKGKNRLLSTPYRQVVAKLYHDPVRDSWKSVDLAEIALFPGLAEDLGRFWSASLMAEVVLNSAGAAPSEPLFDLTVDGLTEANAASGAKIGLVTAQFLWRALYLFGLGPDLDSCTRCDASTAAWPVVYVSSEDGLVCPDCARSTDLAVPAGGLKYLQASLGLAWSACRNLGCSEPAAQALRAAAVMVLETQLGKPLKSFHTAPGIL